MKLLMFSRLYSPHLGGVEKHVKKISAILLQRGFKITLITEKFEDKLAEQEVIDGIEVYRVRLFKKIKWFNKFKIWWWLVKNWKLIKEADIIHCHDIFFWYLPFRFLFPKKPVYITFHGWEGTFPLPKRFVFIRKIWERLAFGNLCVGDYLAKWYSLRPAFVTYGGVDLKETRPVKRVKNKAVFIGRLEEDLDLPKYFKIFKKLKNFKKDWEIEFVGDGPLRIQAEKLGKVWGFVEDIWSKIAEARLVFASSYLAIIEAMSMGKVVVAVWDNPLKKDYLLLSSFKNLIVTGPTTAVIIEKLLPVLRNPKRQKAIGEMAHRWGRAQTWEKVVEKYLRLWKIGV
jgi:glycosyltransferase involved in cell wall biosynthesis